MSEVEEETPDIEEPESDQPDPDRVAREVEAKKYGWRPKEDFDRDPEGWVDADRFLELPSTGVKMLRDTKRDLEKRVEESEKARAVDIARVEATSRAAIEAVRMQERQRYDTELTAVREAKRQAASMADVARYDALETRERQLSAPPVRQSDEKQPHPDAVEYAARPEGAWLNNPELAKAGFHLIEANPSVKVLPPKVQIAFAEAELRKFYPTAFAAPAQQEPPKASRVDGGGLAGGGRRTKGADDLPADVRKVAAGFVKEGVFKDINAYAAAYWKDN